MSLSLHAVCTVNIVDGLVCQPASNHIMVIRRSVALSVQSPVITGGRD